MTYLLMGKDKFAKGGLFMLQYLRYRFIHPTNPIISTYV